MQRRQIETRDRGEGEGAGYPANPADRRCKRDPMEIGISRYDDIG
jgi:hypothetical protein